MSMSAPDTLVWHYTATYDDDDIGMAEIRQMHRARGWRREGYHGAIRLSGAREWGRPLNQTGAHVKNQNSGKIGFVTIGGLQRATGGNVGVDTRNREQIAAQIDMTRETLTRFSSIRYVTGHRNLAATQCPGYDVPTWWAEAMGNRVPAPHLVPPDAPTVSFAMLKRGSRGKGVRMLQDALASLGHDPGPIDGVFGRRTDKALRHFQIAAEIVADGKAGPVTWSKLQLAGRS